MCQAAFTLRCAWAWQLLKAKADSVHGVVAANAMLARDLREKETLVALLQARSMTSLNAAQPRPHWDWAHPSHICSGTGFTPPALRRDWAPPPPTSAPGLGPPPPTSAPGLGRAAEPRPRHVCGRSVRFRLSHSALNAVRRASASSDCADERTCTTELECHWYLAVRRPTRSGCSSRWTSRLPRCTTRSGPLPRGTCPVPCAR